MIPEPQPDVASQCVENPVIDDFAYSRWAETDAAGVPAHTVPLEDDRVLMVRPAEQHVLYTPLTVTCGEKRVQTRLHFIIYPFDAGHNAAASSWFVLAETVAELAAQYEKTEIMRPKELYAQGESDTLRLVIPTLRFQFFGTKS